MKTLLLLSVLIFSAVLFSSCDEESARVLAPSADEILNRTWVLKRMTLKENNTSVEDLSQYKDMTIKFSADGTYTARNASHAFPLESGVWAWADADLKKDVVLDAGQPEEAYLKMLTLQADLIKVTFTREGRIISGGREQVIPKREFDIELKNL